MQPSVRKVLSWIAALTFATPIFAAAVSVLEADYFNVTYTIFYDRSAPPFTSTFSADLSDPITGNGTTCRVDVSHSVPGHWTTCDDPTFHMKIDSFNYGGAWGLEFKHQYTGAGNKCKVMHGPDCTTARAYVGYDIKYSAGLGEGHSATGSWESIFFSEPVAATVFSRCDAGCGTNSGAY